MKILFEDKLSMESTVFQCPGNITSDMDGETVMLNIENGKYYNLGNTGGYIWSSIKVPITINKLITKLTNEFDVEISECREEVIPFLELLLKERLITVENGE